MITRARDKVGEAEFFLVKMRSLDRSPNLETAREFQYYFSAFLSASRSPLQILCPDSSQWEWATAEKQTWPADEQTLYDAFKDFRDVSIHIEKVEAGFKVAMVPEWEVPQRHRRTSAPYGSYTPRLPGNPPPQVGLASYSLSVGGIETDALDCCTRYIGLIQRLVNHREGMSSW
jgi:hypothetical protein